MHVVSSSSPNLLVWVGCESPGKAFPGFKAFCHGLTCSTWLEDAVVSYETQFSSPSALEFLPLIKLAIAKQAYMNKNQ
jgi:hypothetical protein